MSGDAWVVVLIVFLTMFFIQVLQFVWIEYLLYRLDVLESGSGRRPELVAHGPLVDDPVRQPGTGKLAPQA